MSDTDMPRRLRLKQIIGDPKANPPIEAIIPISGDWSTTCKTKSPVGFSVGFYFQIQKSMRGLTRDSVKYYKRDEVGGE